MSTRGLLRASWLGLLGLLGVACLLAAMTWASLYTAAGTRWLTQALTHWVPGLRIEQVQGALLGDAFQVQNLSWQQAPAREGEKPRSIRMQGVAWTQAALAWDAQAPWKMRLVMPSAVIESMAIDWPSQSVSETPAQVPDLRLPVGVQVASLKVQRLSSPTLGEDPIMGLHVAAQVEQVPLGASGASASTIHRWRLHALQWQAWQLSGDMALTASADPAVVNARLDAHSPTDQASITLTGPLSRLALAGQVRVQPRRESEIQDAPSNTRLSISAQATLTPLLPWPVEMARVEADQLDLQRLNARWPSTQFTGHAQMQPVASSAAPGAWPEQLRLTLDASNALAGAWDKSQVPVKQLQAETVLKLPSRSQPGRWAEVWRAGDGKVSAVLAGQGAQLSVQGHWDMDQRQNTLLKATLTQIDTRALHTAAPSLRLNGPVNVQGTADAQWRISGQLVGTDQAKTVLPQAVKAAWAATWQPGLIKVDTMQLEAAGASAKGQGQWQQQSDARWTSVGQLALASFDPAVWMPWPRPSGDAAQPTRLQGQTEWQLSATGTAPSAVSQLQGQIKGQLGNSTLLGVPTTGQWQVAMAPRQWRINADVKASGNSMQVQASLPMSGNNAAVNHGAVRWHKLVGAQLTAQLQAPQLVALQPWVAHWGVEQLQGQINGQITLDVPSSGHWHTRGDLKAEKLSARWQGEPADLQGLQADWSLSSEQGKGSVPWRVKASVEQGRWANWVLQQWSGELEGTANQHRWTTVARLDLPPRTLPSGRVFKESLRLQSVGQGQWQAQGKLGRWKAQVDALRVAPLTLDVIPTWFDTPGFTASLAASETGVRWQLDPARLSVLGLDFDVQQAQGVWGEQPSMDIQAQLASVRVADLLGRWQPKAGWGGDLSIDGQIRLVQRPAMPWVVDISLGRKEGDLTLTDTGVEGSGAQALGLQKIRLSLQAQNGVWTARQSLDGVLLGQVEASQVVTPANALAWPGMSDKLKGDVQASISDARALGAWAPAGWRLAGHVDARAALGGTVGEPLYQGVITGQQLGAQNALLGIYLSEGQLKLNLQGSKAELEQLSLRGGSDQGGMLHVTGQASLSGQPEANLQIKAERFGLLNRSDRRARVSGQAQVQLKGQDSVKVDGTLTFDEGLFDVSRIDTPTVGDDVNVINRPGQVDDSLVGGETSALAKRQWYVQLGLNLGQQLRVKGRGLDTRLSGSLRFSTPNGRPQVHGSVAAVDGSYVSYGQKLVIERGSLNFSGPIDNPRLDIKAMRAQSAMAESSDVKVGVLITGTAVDPRVRLYSEPPMSETEKLSWLVLGRGPTGLGVADIGLLQTAASALWGGEGASPKDTLVGTLGLDELSIRQTDGAVRDTIVTVGKQISRRWYLGYERSLNATTGTWQAIFRAAQRLTVRLQTGDDDAIDLIWLWRRGE